MAHFGIDLAWSDRNPSGACALDPDGRVVDERLLGSDDELIAWIAAHLAGPAVVAVDAPLMVPNETGRRPCEREIHRVYGSRRAGAHSSNRSLFRRRMGRVRGEELAGRLAALGFGDPWAGRDRTVLEVYPHPALIEVFGLPERLAYKKGRVADRRNGLRRLGALLGTLAAADPPLVADPIPITDETRGRALKGVEDALDARLCAWLAMRWAQRGAAGFRIFGDRAAGHIAVPRPEA